MRRSVESKLNGEHRQAAGPGEVDDRDVGGDQGGFEHGLRAHGDDGREEHGFSQGFGRREEVTRERAVEHHQRGGAHGNGLPEWDVGHHPAITETFSVVIDGGNTPGIAVRRAGREAVSRAVIT